MTKAQKLISETSKGLNGQSYPLHHQAMSKTQILTLKWTQNDHRGNHGLKRIQELNFLTLKWSRSKA